MLHSFRWKFPRWIAKRIQQESAGGYSISKSFFLRDIQSVEQGGKNILNHLIIQPASFLRLISVRWKTAYKVYQFQFSLKGTRTLCKPFIVGEIFIRNLWNPTINLFIFITYNLLQRFIPFKWIGKTSQSPLLLEHDLPKGWDFEIESTTLSSFQNKVYKLCQHLHGFEDKVDVAFSPSPHFTQHRMYMLGPLHLLINKIPYFFPNSNQLLHS